MRRSPLEEGEIVYVLSSRLKKKDAPNQKCFANNEKKF